MAWPTSTACIWSRSAQARASILLIGDDFQAEHKEEFDQNYMRALYR
jgi:hypothetical protein